MAEVCFYKKDYFPGNGLIYSVIAARFGKEWLFVRHHDRSTWEIAGGHIEIGESAYDAACRELREETGATEFEIDCVATYSVTNSDGSKYGRLFFAEIHKFGQVPDISEIAEISLSETMPLKLTYPDIQPLLFNKILDYVNMEHKP